MTVDESNACGDLRRAQRYDIVMPVRFRAGAGEWLDGATVNISRIGLLVRTRYASSPSTRLDLRIALTDDESPSGAHVACSGRVLRCEQVAGAGEQLMAVTIDDSQLRPAANRDDD